MHGIQDKLATLQKDGIVSFDNVLSAEQVDALRAQLLIHLEKSGRTYNGGNTQNDAINVIESIQWLINETLLPEIVRAVAGEDAVYVHHSDALHNTYTGWHRDHIGHPPSGVPLNFWPEQEDEPYEVYKFVFYLQDHGNDKTALKYLPGSHLRSTPYSLLTRLYHYFFFKTAQPSSHTMVVFDQRIFHNGASPSLPTKLLLKLIKNPSTQQKLWNMERRFFGYQDRVFLQIAFGKPGEFANQHAREMVARQQEKKGESSYVVSVSLAKKLQASGIGLADVDFGQTSVPEPAVRLSDSGQ